MKKRDRRSQYSPTTQAPQPGRGALGEARALFERMKGEAVRQSEREREEARSRGPLARLLLVLTIVACLLAAATMLYGVYNFPDAPIREAGGAYVGKGGKPHTRDEFEAYVLWGNAMFIVVPTAFVLGFAFAIADSKRGRRSASGVK